MFSQTGSLAAVPLLAAHHPFLKYHFGWSTQPVLALVAGILILIRPKLLNFIVAIYLILVGITGVMNLSW